MAKKLSVKEPRAPYVLSLDDTSLGEETVIIERRGEAVAAIVPIEEYRRLRQLQVWSEQEAGRYQEELRTFQEDREVFLRLLPELLKTHPGQFVAIFHGRLVDADPDQWALAKRIYAKYGYQPIYMDKVEKPRVYEFPS